MTEKLSDEKIITVIEQGQGPMPGNPQLSKQDTLLLLDFLKDPKPISKSESSGSEQLGDRARFVSGFGLVRASNGLSLISPPWTTLTAYNLNNGTIAWQKPFGDVAALAKKGIHNTGSAFQKVGPVVTASGLIFTGGKDGIVRAFDSKTGDILWQKDLGVAMEGIPAVYEVEGKQFLLFCASAQKGLTRETEETIRGQYIALALSN